MWQTTHKRDKIKIKSLGKKFHDLIVILKLIRNTFENERNFSFSDFVLFTIPRGRLQIRKT